MLPLQKENEYSYLHGFRAGQSAVGIHMEAGHVLPERLPYLQPERQLHQALLQRHRTHLLTSQPHPPVPVLCTRTPKQLLIGV